MSELSVGTKSKGFWRKTKGVMKEQNEPSNLKLKAKGGQEHDLAEPEILPLEVICKQYYYC